MCPWEGIRGAPTGHPKIENSPCHPQTEQHSLLTLSITRVTNTPSFLSLLTTLLVCYTFTIMQPHNNPYGYPHYFYPQALYPSAPHMVAEKTFPPTGTTPMMQMVNAPTPIYASPTPLTTTPFATQSRPQQRQLVEGEKEWMGQLYKFGGTADEDATE
jgi:hypothetical protein